MFSKYIGIKDSNEGEVLAILEALRICFSNNFHSIVVESNSLNAISWMSCLEEDLWKFQFLFNEIKTWSSSLNVEFHHVLRSGNGMADALAKLGVEREVALLAPL
eukprot:TRINITY_DN6784_c0_g1_i2.p2 TRINITY_DN6784_c0_g1~~TRINITY_DN6784_c0_g1_i2.p2  ORF type:complete len:105 (-),score=19.94 TRINITY_DN6784_c0_g1_i2:1073-1387(-)